MKYYPINLRIKNRPCLIVGGGKVAFRKLCRLIDCSAKIQLISPKVDSKIQDKSDLANVEIIQRTVQQSDLDAMFMVFAATDHAQVNESVARWAFEKNVLCNIADRPDLSDFTLPSIIEQGDLNLTVSTNGKSPALSKYVCRRLKAEFGDEYAIFLNMMGHIRNILSNEISDQEDRQKIYRSLIDSPLLECFKENDMEQVSSICQDLTGFAFDDIMQCQCQNNE